MGGRLVVTLVFAALLLAAPAGAAPERAAPCTYRLGFAALHDLIPEVVGECAADETHNPQNGDGLQQTERGLLVWRKADNWTAFTDGTTTWINGPGGLVRRANSQRFCWEVDSTADGCLTESGVTEPELPPFTPAPTTGPQATGQPTATVAGQVSVTADAPVYAVGQPIRATVANGLAGTLYTADMKSGCSILFLERRRGEGWEPLVGCALERAPLVVAIDTGRGVEVTLDPTSVHFADPATGQGSTVTAGEYRLRVTYRLTPDGSGEEPLEASSAPFRVGP